MDKEKAIEILRQVAVLAQSKGVLTLEEAVVVAEAVKLLDPNIVYPAPQEREGTPTVETEEVKQ